MSRPPLRAIHPAGPPLDPALRPELRERAAAGAGLAELVAHVCAAYERRGEVAGRFVVVRALLVAFDLPVRLGLEIAAWFEDRTAPCESLEQALSRYLRPEGG